MPVTATSRDADALTLVLVADLAAPPARVWQVWADARQLSRWWGPPTWPATFVDHDLTVGGRSSYYMTGPDGEKAHGWWHVVTADEPHLIEFDDGFSGDDGAPNLEMPTTHSRVDLAADGGGTRMTITSRFASADQMTQLLQMGMEEGLTGAVGQIDAIVAEG